MLSQQKKPPDFMNCTIYTDGASRGNPGPASFGVYIQTDQGKTFELKGYIGEQTNNVAEYTAVIQALNWLVEHHVYKAELNSDSELIVKQLQGSYKVKSKGLRPLFQNIQNTIRENQLHIKFNHIRREYNEHADQLANEALDEWSYNNSPFG